MDRDDPWANYDPEALLDGLQEIAGTLSPAEGERMKSSSTAVVKRAPAPSPGREVSGRFRLADRRVPRRPRGGYLLARLRGDGVAVSVVSYGELFEGAIGASDPAAELARFRRFLDRLVLLPLDDPIRERFARIRAELRRRGQLIPDFDLLIAATAIHHELILLTRNVRHFERVSELKLYEPS